MVSIAISHEIRKPNILNWPVHARTSAIRMTNAIREDRNRDSAMKDCKRETRTARNG